MANKPKKISGLAPETFAKRIKTMNEMVEKMKKVVNNLHVYISKGNSKTGTLVPSVSLVPVRCCPNCSCCSKLCYDVRTDCMYKGVQNTRAINTALWESDPDRYFLEIRDYVRSNNVRYFRWHVGGDIMDERYLRGILWVCNSCPDCKFLAFTKNFSLINSYLDEYDLPNNLQVIFSCWVGQDTPNPHNLPTSHPVFADGSTTAHYGAFYCTGNCSVCAETHTGCWTLKRGQEVVFLAH